MEWLVASLVVSVILTVLLNVAIRLFPDESGRAARRLEEHVAQRDPDDQRNVRVFVPWKAMLIGSLLLTIAINVVLRL